LNEIGDVEESSAKHDYVQPVDRDLMKRLKMKTYQPMFQSSRESLLGDLTKGISQAQSIGRGFANYGGRNKAVNDINNNFYKSLGDEMSLIENSRAGARRDLNDILKSWKTTIYNT
jgi:hypothetical protein